MSGITCIVNFDGSPVDRRLVKAMTAQVAHRGPHGESILVEKNLGFGFLALHTTPESEYECQPIDDKSRGLILLSDSRLDNREELMCRLGIPKSEAARQTDAHLIIYCYEKWGMEAASHLLGDFAFVIWDSRRQELYAARDPMGIKSLHYARFGDSLCVTSEAQQILQHPRASNELDELSAVEWLSGQVTGASSMFRDVKVVPPGFSIQVGRNTLRKRRDWSIESRKKIRYQDPRQYEEHLVEVLGQAVRARMRTRSGVIGTELSGGLDSTTVTAIAKKMLGDEGQQLRAISYQYPSTPSCDETRFIQSTADFIGIDTEYIDAEKNGAFGYPREHKHSLESPWVRHYPIMAFELKRLSAAGVDALLTGTGGDEVASGGALVFFHRFWRGDWRAVAEIVEFCQKNKLRVAPTFYQAFLNPGLPKKADAVLRLLTGREPRSGDELPPWLSDRARALIKADAGSKIGKGPRLGNRAANAMHNNLYGGPLPASMGTYEYMGSQHGIEVRHPFLDRRVIEFCFAVPIELWNQQLFAKWLLRRATRRLLPDEVRWRVDKSIATEVFGKAMALNMDYIDGVLGSDFQQKSDLFDSKRLSSEFHSHFERVGGVIRRDLDFALSMLCWLHTNEKWLK